MTVDVLAACGRLLARGFRALRGTTNPGPSARSTHRGKSFREDRSERRQRIETTLQRWARQPAGERHDRAEALPYRRAKHLLSKGERAFWYPLYRAVKGKFRIFCKVRLADVVRAPADIPDERRWFRKIARYHVDFVICDPHTTEPLLVVELDDRTHRTKEQRERDQFKQDVLGAGGLPLYRVRAQAAYDPQELSETIVRMIAEQPPQ